MGGFAIFKARVFAWCTLVASTLWIMTTTGSSIWLRVRAQIRGNSILFIDWCFSGNNFRTSRTAAQMKARSRGEMKHFFMCVCWPRQSAEIQTSSFPTLVDSCLKQFSQPKCLFGPCVRPHAPSVVTCRWKPKPLIYRHRLSTCICEHKAMSQVKTHTYTPRNNWSSGRKS